MPLPQKKTLTSIIMVNVFFCFTFVTNYFNTRFDCNGFFWLKIKEYFL